MRITDLRLKDIGPFREAYLSFSDMETEKRSPSVVFITGENGTGKSIILDAIRGLFLGPFGALDRDITASSEFSAEISFLLNEKKIRIQSDGLRNHGKSLNTDNLKFNYLFTKKEIKHFRTNWILDFWTSKLSNDDFSIKNIAAIEPENYLKQTLTGIHSNVDLTRSITFLDYLKDSANQKEREVGRYLYDLLKEIIDTSINDGAFSHVSRIDLKPMVKVGGAEVSLDKLSSGNLYLIQRLTSILSQIYAICVLNDLNVDEYKDISGVVLIDEAENHLHPKWQKLFLPNVLELFPNLQLIVATHSPFIIASVPDARVYVCKTSGTHSVVEEETDYYSNKPIEEILMSPLFNTNNFNAEISQLMEDRKAALRRGKSADVARIEEKLLDLNPEYFDYLNLDTLLQSIKK